ncbi:hypothetical protein HMPREF1084_00769 [Clostridium butyricum 60E.3]|uniref:GGDEF domain-containing protein n=1 Tax=Clostridium butyricum TaxID=1492 RepID=A0A6N3EHX8_CLOBU|nr:hypothetical protein [Clostridium butyricum]ENZ36185.1 hypothetical protein HMPREF1084_00769 [Clostridium butyricum 60E.3]MZI79267.1 hypothetical protein [Clostridium butyricum]
MIKRRDRNKLNKGQIVDILRSVTMLNLLLCIMTITLILYEAIKHKSMILYLSVGLIVCIILSDKVRYMLKENHESTKIKNMNSIIEKENIDNWEFELYNCKDNISGLYNSVFLENILEKINKEKFIPTTIAVFYIKGLSCLMEEEEKKKAICKAADIVIKNKLKNNIACLSKSSSIILFFINYNKNNSVSIIEKICHEFNELYAENDLTMIYGFEEISSKDEIIYKMYGEILQNIHLSIFK